jgi:seryl-tRNA synthetase
MRAGVTNAKETETVLGDRLEAMAAVLLKPMGVQGVYARSRQYEEVVDRLSGLISSQRDPSTEVLRFPPVISRRDLEKSGYLKSFPNLLGFLSALHGSETEIRAAAEQFAGGGDWTAALDQLDLVLSPAACYPVYPLVASRGSVPLAGLCLDVACECFRHEPSRHLDRMQSFRMREFVFIGSPAQTRAFRESWIERARELARELDLPHQLAPASDPFFGRTGQMMAVSQLQQSLKFELLVPIRLTTLPTACISFNYHLDHFGSIWDLRDEAGAIAHTGCVAFGMDRLALALFWRHGINVLQWPASVRLALGFD